MVDRPDNTDVPDNDRSAIARKRIELKQQQEQLRSSKEMTTATSTSTMTETTTATVTTATSTMMTTMTTSTTATTTTTTTTTATTTTTTTSTPTTPTTPTTAGYEANSTANETDKECCKREKETSMFAQNGCKTTIDDTKDLRNDVDSMSNYSNKLEKFESLTNFEVRSRLKRSESLNKRSENTSSKLKRSESLNKHSVERLSSPTNGKLKRSESLNKHSERSDSPNSKLKRSESLTKTEKTECNISKRRQSVRKDSATKLKRKNGMPERSIKRRHTVGGTKDFDKVHWLDNKLQVEAEKVVRNEYRPKKSQLRTSSPDLSTARIGLTDASFLIEVSFRGPSNVVFNVTNARPQSLPDTSLTSKVYKVPLESHV